VRVELLLWVSVYSALCISYRVFLRTAEPVSTRTPLRARLLAGDTSTATAIGLDPGLFAGGLSGSLTPNAEAYVWPMIEKAAFVWSVNDAWAMLAAFALLGVLVVPFAWRTKHASAVAIKAN
jgi:hypothetical protein